MYKRSSTAATTAKKQLKVNFTDVQRRNATLIYAKNARKQYRILIKWSSPVEITRRQANNASVVSIYICNCLSMLVDALKLIAHQTIVAR
jgi:hypothetical protein